MEKDNTEDTKEDLKEVMALYNTASPFVRRLALFFLQKDREIADIEKAILAIQFIKECISAGHTIEELKNDVSSVFTVLSNELKIDFKEYELKVVGYDKNDE